MSDIISRRRGPAEGWEDAFASGGNMTGVYDLISRRRGPAEGWEDAFASGGNMTGADDLVTVRCVDGPSDWRCASV